MLAAYHTEGRDGKGTLTASAEEGQTGRSSVASSLSGKTPGEDGGQYVC